MKPNHNTEIYHLSSTIVVYTMSKIQNETKSQPLEELTETRHGCLYYVKDTK